MKRDLGKSKGLLRPESRDPARQAMRRQRCGSRSGPSRMLAEKRRITTSIARPHLSTRAFVELSITSGHGYSTRFAVTIARITTSDRVNARTARISAPKALFRCDRTYRQNMQLLQLQRLLSDSGKRSPPVTEAAARTVHGEAGSEHAPRI